MSWSDGERYSSPLQSVVVSLLLSLVSTLVLSRTGGVLSRKSFDTQIPSVSTEQLVLPVVVVVVVYPTPSEGWGHGGRPWSPRSRATPQGLDQRS